mgnify:CR=1 FL=1
MSFNSTILNSITHYIAENQDSWDEISYIATYANNTTGHFSKRYTPFELILVRTLTSHVLSRSLAVGAATNVMTKEAYRTKFLAEGERVTVR